MSASAGAGTWTRVRAAGAGLAVVGLVLASLGNLLLPGAIGPNSPGVAFVIFAGIVAACGGVGALVVTRQPGNAVGWILWLIGVLIGLSTATNAYAIWSYSDYHSTLPGTALAGWLAQWGFTPPLVIALLFLPLLFPDGRPPSPRWRPAVAFAIVTVVLASLPDMITPGPVGPGGNPNPTAWTGDPAVLGVLRIFSQVSPLLALPVVVASAVVRFRRGSSVERQQLKWFGATAAFALLALIVGVLASDPVAVIAWVTAMVGVGLMPIAIGIAILRYRLYAIDRLISRTISWAVVSLTIVAVFIVLLISIQTALVGITQAGTLSVAASTLAAFALFQPLRRRVQAAVDRRFDRAGYDGQRIVDAFAERLRNEVELAEIRDGVFATVDRTVRPAHGAIWIREARP